MKKNLFLTLTMVFLGLFVGMHTANAINISGMTPEEAETLGFWARLTAMPATTTNGSGKVFVSDESDTPADGDYNAISSSKDGWSDIFLMSSLIDADVEFYVFAKADPGSYFTGWSFTDGYTDLGIGSGYLYTKVTPSSKKAHANIREHIIYAAFEPIRLTSYEFVSGTNTTADDGLGNWTCTQTIKFRAETPGTWNLSGEEDVRHFKLPTLTPKAGTTGTWTTSISAWNTSNITFYGDYAEISVPVTFTAPNSDVAEYGATLTLETYAGVKMNVYLYARTTGGSGEAIRYNKSKVLQESGDLTDLLDNAASGDIIKLNGNYSNSVSIDKNITFDLNGYTLSNTLTISDGNVTLAYSPYGGSVNALTVTGGKAILNGGTIGLLTITGAVVEQNGATISGINNNGTLTTTDGVVNGALTSSGALTINGGTFINTSGEAITITNGTATIKRGSITGQTYGVKTTGGTTTIEKLATVSGNTKALNGAGGSLTVNNGKFTDPDNLIAGTVTFNAGYFQTATGSTALGKQVWRNTAGPEFREGYEFFVGDQDAAQASNVSVCRIGQTAYSSLEEALAYANNSGQRVLIFLENNYVLKAGYYTVPANATLIVPMVDNQEVAYPVVPRETGSYVTPYAFRTLTLADGVNINVQGTIELTCGQYKNGTAEQSLPGGAYGHLILKPGSHMTINNGGELRAWGYVTGDGTQDGSGKYLSGEIDARRGSIVREQFQMGDWKGGDISFTMILDQAPQNMTHLFPVYMYFIQNVESPVKYHPGASLICATSVVVSGTISAYADDIKVIGKNGEPAMFLMDEMADADNTWVRKWYDAQHDKQVYEVNSGAQLGSMVIDLGEVPAALIKPGTPGMFNIQLDSRKFVLPLTSNFKIHLLSGNMQFTQSTSCLPGMEVEIDKESEISIINQGRDGIVEGALYLYDADQWCFMNNPSLGGYVGLSKGKFGAIVHYSATWDLGTNGTTKRPNVRDISSPSAIGDAILNVHGTFRADENCSVYTTWTKGTGSTIDDNPFMLNNTTGTGGASIISTNEDAGTFIFDADAPSAFEGVTWDDPANFGQISHLVSIGPDVLVNFDNNNYGSSSYPIAIGTALHSDVAQRMFGWELCTPAKLKNGTGAEQPFTETQGTVAGKSYCYMNNRWTSMEVAEENDCFMKDNFGVFYAKPAEYVAVAASVVGGKVVGNDDHTYSDLAGAGRLFILMKDDCQWWEVEKKDNLYHCIHPNNDTYYYWDDITNPSKPKWAEKRFTITWKNYDGSEIKSYTYDGVTGDPEEVEYSVTYGTMAEFLGSNPTRPENIDYTYDFTGWQPELGPVTSDVTYTATYVEQPRKYTIIFTNEGGDEIERQFLTHNEVPECENVPTRTGFTLQWEPAIAAVTGDATYRATWLEEPPTEYQITFVDYDGDLENHMLWQGNVAVGTMPTPPANPSGKPETSEFSYVFDHWSPALSKVTQAMTYTAVYREVAKTYTISYYMEDGSTLNTTEELPYGATPTPPVVTKENPETGHTYTLVWKNLAETGTIQTVQGAASYKPTYLDVLNKYTVTVKSNPSGACSSTGAGLYDYNTSATLTLSVHAGYTFNGWSDGLDGTNTTRTITVTEDKELVANFTVAEPDYTITWKNENGSANLVDPVGQKAGTATIYPGATPTKDATAQYSYTFDGWATEANGPKVYKNGLTPVASGDATYYAHFSSIVNTYKVTLTSNPAGVCTFTGAGTYEYGADVTIAVASYNTTNYTFTGWSAAVPTTVEGDINLTANFSPRTYTITWKSEDGSATLETDASQAYGAATAFNASEPSKDGGVFAGWTTAANGEGSFYTNGSTPAVAGDAIYFAYFNAVPQETLSAGVGDVVAAEAKAYSTITITSNGVSSGQITNAGAIISCENAYFDLNINAAAKTWYAVAVPWQVEVSNGVLVNDVPQVVNSTFYLLTYSGAIRAASGPSSDNWIFASSSDVMQPGTLYMIYLENSATTIRFKKKAGENISTTELSVHQYPSANVTDAGWNGIANPSLYHAYLNPGADTYYDEGTNHHVGHNQYFGQKYIPGEDRYEGINMSEAANIMIVGAPIFVQVAADKSPVTAYTTWSEAAAHAPRRTPIVDNAYYEVQISAGEDYTDRLYLRTLEDKEDAYVIGLDLAKAGVSTKVAQMWVDRYNTKLCVNTTAPVGTSATYPLGISIPQTGEYQIYSATEMQDGQELYVTRNGKVIWNLAYGPYTLEAEPGTYSEYGLKLIQAPATTTDMDQITNDNLQIRKVLIDNQVYIVRDGAVYTITGQKVN